MDIDEILNKTWMVGLDIPLWSGTSKVAVDNLRLRNGTELPKTVYKAGGMYVVDNKILNPFIAIKREAERAVGSAGIRSNLFRGFLVPRDKWDDLERRLLQLKQKHAAEKRDFIATLPTAIEEWAERHAEASEVCDAIRDAAPPLK